MIRKNNAVFVYVSMHQELVPLFNNLKYLRIVEPYNYLEKTAELLELLEEMNVGSNGAEINHLMFQIDRVKEIQDNVRLTGLYVESGGKEREYIERLHKDVKTPLDRLTHVWLDFLHKVNDAPTSIHCRGVVILLMPILYTEMLSYNQFLQQNERTSNSN
jgi:hypothetical protein